MKINSYCQEHCKGYQETGKCFADGGCKAKKDAEHNSTWSKEDEEMFDAVVADIQFTQKAHIHEANQVVYKREIDWLKSLKDRYTWRPSDEQMEALDDVIDEYDGYPEFDSLVSLKNDLKKLKS